MLRPQFNRSSSYIKKVIDDNNQAEGTAMLLKVCKFFYVHKSLAFLPQFCCWENYPFSFQILSELMKQVTLLKQINSICKFVVITFA